jgi:Zn-dependent peptidase ImmA (M78 family)
MNIVNTSKLILARETRGKTQHELVAMIPNLSQGTYSKMEKGLMDVPDETLTNIARELDYPISFFYKDGVHTPISSFYYRKRVSMAKKHLTVLEAKLDVIRLCVDELLDSIELPEYKLPAFEITDDCSPTDVARKLRDFLRLPKGPVKNLIRLLEAAGVIVYFIKTDVEKFDGITLLTDKGQPIIFVNDSFPNDRKRFTIAHELIHLVAHIPFSPLSADRDEEAEANAGAAEFLMPYLDCRSDIQGVRYSQLGTLKQYWGVSKAMVIVRAKTINAITSDKFTNLFVELSRHGERKKETGFVELEEPTLINLVIQAYENDLGYSLEDILQILSISRKDYVEYFTKSKYSTPVRAKKVIEFNPNKDNTAR